jgi:signal peptidase II
MKRVWLVPVSAASVFALDVASKLWALNNLRMGETQAFMPGLLQLTLTTNTGGAFGFAKDFREIMTVLPMLICAGIIYWIYKRQTSGQPLTRLEQIGFGSILGGALGNIADRLLRGKVTDFLEFAFVSFPVFNVADAFIDVGIACLLIASFLPAKPQDTNSKTQ